jgi:hypothetical protein
MNNLYEIVPHRDEINIIETYRYVKKNRLIIGMVAISAGALAIVNDIGTTFANGIWITIGCFLLVIGGLLAIWDQVLNGCDDND